MTFNEIINRINTVVEERLFPDWEAERMVVYLIRAKAVVEAADILMRRYSDHSDPELNLHYALRALDEVQ